jgi:hypothetical protein
VIISGIPYRVVFCAAESPRDSSCHLPPCGSESPPERISAATNALGMGMTVSGRIIGERRKASPFFSSAQRPRTYPLQSALCGSRGSRIGCDIQRRPTPFSYGIPLSALQIRVCDRCHASAPSYFFRHALNSTSCTADNNLIQHGGMPFRSLDDPADVCNIRLV